MSVRSLSLDLDGRDTVRLWANRSEAWACLVLQVDETSCEIRLDRVHVEALRDGLPEVLAGLDRWAAEDAACEKAEVAGKRVADLAAQALDQAVAAEAAGAVELATSVRAAVAEAAEKANAVDAVVRAFDDATAEADLAAERLIYATHEAEKILSHRQDNDRDRPAELAAT